MLSVSNAFAEVKGSVDPLQDALNYSKSGSRAASIYLQLIAKNIANVETTDSGKGNAYCREYPVFKTLDKGLVIERIVRDQEIPLQQVYNPTHPHADKNGFVMMPNVDLPNELVRLSYVSQWYQANGIASSKVKEMREAVLELTR